MSYHRQVFFMFLCILISIKCLKSALLYPQFTVMQLIGSVSVPVVDLPSDRKVFFDWGLQMNYDMPYNISSFYMVPIWPTNRPRHLLKNSGGGVHRNDFTAKQLYDGLENTLQRYGFHSSCLKQSICELSQHPFDEVYANILTDIVSFLLKPSMHQRFSDEDKYEETPYSLAENQGFSGNNCQELYPKCIQNLFNILTITS